MGLRPRTGRRVAQWDAHSARILSRRVTRRGHYTNRLAAPRLQRPPARSTEVDAACTSGAEVSCSTLWIGLHASQQAQRPAYSVLASVFDAVSTLHQLGSNGGVRVHTATACRICRPRPMARRHYPDQACTMAQLPCALIQGMYSLGGASWQAAARTGLVLRQTSVPRPAQPTA